MVRNRRDFLRDKDTHHRKWFAGAIVAPQKVIECHTRYHSTVAWIPSTLESSRLEIMEEFYSTDAILDTVK